MPPRRRPVVPVPFVLRRATASDTDLLVRHRLAMFASLGGQPKRGLARHGPRYAAWLVPQLAKGELIAWVAEGSDGRALGSGAVWFQPAQPRPGFDDLRVPYILSIYTEPSARGHGVATAIVRKAIGLAKRLGYARVTLHASPMGRGVYERLGFGPTSEMRYWIDPVLRARYARRAAREAAERADSRGTTRTVRTARRSARARR
ncbi:MAG TPA: GNAT family N-acetyltransferase [Thermoplasmata archaeon]|nr:GNAT family N-acetyltransferase [Thermoplasmata archaeon]